MLLKHVALVCGSEENSDRFYESILGLKKMHSKTVPSELSRKIFNLDSELKIVNYADENLRFEIFITNQAGYIDTRVEHVCLEVADLNVFLEKCRVGGAKVNQIPRGDYPLTFIRDFDGNLFEIKEK